MHDAITCGFTSNTSLAIYCRDHGLLLHIHRAMHAVIDRQKIHGIHFRVLAKCLRMSGGDHLHSGTVVGKLEGDRAIMLGFVDLMREECVQQDRSRGVYIYNAFVVYSDSVTKIAAKGPQMASRNRVVNGILKMGPFHPRFGVAIWDSFGPRV